MARAFQDNGAEIVGPVANVDDALDLLEKAGTIDAAVLDVNFQGEMAYSVADALLVRSVPFVFATGYDASFIPEKSQEVTCCEKPVEPDKVWRALCFGARLGKRPLAAVLARLYWVVD